VQNIKTKKKFNQFILVTFSAFAFLFVTFQLHHYMDLRSFYLSKVQKISQSISDSFYFYYHNVQNISLHGSVQEKKLNESSDYFDSLIALYPMYEYIVYTDTDGKVLTMNSIGNDGKKLPWKTLIGKDLSSESWVQRVSGKVRDEDFHKGIFGSSLGHFQSNEFAKEYFKRDVIGMNFSSVVRDEKGDVIGYINTFINQKWIQDKLEVIKGSQIDKIESNIYIIDKYNKIIGDLDEQTNSLDQLPFELKTSNITQSLLSGDIINLIKNIEVFLTTPLFISSEFQHKKFLDSVGWKAILKVDKKSFFQDFMYKFIAFATLFMIWAMFLKTLESSLKIDSENNINNTSDDDEYLFKLKLVERSFKNHQDRVLDYISKINRGGDKVDFELTHIKPIRLENPYDGFEDINKDITENRDTFLKLQVFFENEEFFLKEMDSFIDKNDESLLSIKDQVDESKRSLLNLQLKNNMPQALVKDLELKLNRIVFSVSDIQNGLETIKERNKDSRLKRSLAWGEFKDNHLGFIQSYFRRIENNEERYHMFENEVFQYNEKLKNYRSQIESKLSELRSRERALVEDLGELETFIRKDIKLNDDAA